MKAPLLLGNDIRKMDTVALGVVKNQDALAISQDALGVQAQRVSAKPGAEPSPAGDIMGSSSSLAAVVTPCDPSRLTQTWTKFSSSGVLKTTDAAGSEWCLSDVEGTEAVGSWRAIPCAGADASAPAMAKFQHMELTNTTTVALVTNAGSHLTPENKHGASGPVAHSRYLSADPRERTSPTSSWLLEPVDAPGGGSDGGADGGGFRLMASDRVNIRDDDKQGNVSMGGDFCLDIVADLDSEVWVGPLAEKKWAVALLNRHILANASITLDWAMLNVSATTSFDVRDIWEGKDLGKMTGKFVANVKPRAVTYLLLEPTTIL